MKILIVEDERVAARGLERMLREQLGAKVTSVKIQATLTAGECFLLDNPIDLLMLDLNLNGEDGFELLKSAAAASFQTIVVSANTDRAIQAYEYGVLDFVAKPVNPDRLRRALERLETTVEASGNFARYVSIRKDETVVLVPLEEVLYFQGQDNYVKIQKKNGESEQHRKTLESLQKTLPPHFMRIHKSYLVDLREIEKILTLGGSKYEVQLKNGLTLPLSRTRYKELKERI